MPGGSCCGPGCSCSSPSSRSTSWVTACRTPSTPRRPSRTQVEVREFQHLLFVVPPRKDPHMNRSHLRLLLAAALLFLPFVVTACGSDNSSSSSDSSSSAPTSDDQSKAIEGGQKGGKLTQ